MGDEEKKYQQDKAQVEGAEKFFSQNASNMRYVENRYTTNGLHGNSGMPPFNPAVPADAKRLYRYDPVTKTLVNDLYTKEGDSAFDTDPGKHYEHIDKFDLEGLEGHYIYFEAGSSSPRYVSKKGGTFDMDEHSFEGDPDFKAAIAAEAAKRSLMSDAEKQNEIQHHNSQCFLYDNRKTTDCLQTLFGSSSADTGSDYNRNFAQTILSDLHETYHGVDYEYNTPNGRLSEADKIAITMLCMGDPSVNGKTVTGENEMWNAAGAVSMWSGDLFIERTGKVGYMLEQLSNARQAAKGIIEEYDRTGDKTLLAALAVRGLEANGLPGGSPVDLGYITYGNNMAASFLDKFVKDPEMAALIEREAERQGKEEEIKESLEKVSFASNLHKSGVTKCQNESRLSNNINGNSEAATEEEKASELTEFAKAAAMNNTVEALLKFEIDTLSSHSSKVGEEFIQNKMKELAAISSNNELSDQERADRMAYVNENLQHGQAGAGWTQHMTGMQKIMAVDGGKYIIEHCLNQANVSLGPNSTNEELRKGYAALEEAGLLPPYPDTSKVENVYQYKEDCGKFNTREALQNYTQEFYLGKNGIKKPEDVMFRIAREKERVNYEATHSKDPLDFEGVEYDKDKVLMGLDAYKVQNPNAGAEEMRKEKCRLVGFEAVVASRTELQNRINEEAGIPDRVTADSIRAELNGNRIEGRPADDLFFTNYTGAELENYLQIYQSETKLCRNQDDFKALLKGRINPMGLIVREDKQRPYEEALEFGEDYHRGLYASQPDGKGMVFDMFGSSGQPDVKGTELLKNTQKEIESIPIPIPPGWHERMVEFAVMGHSFTDESIARFMKNARGQGSTIPEGFSDRNVARIFAFTNCFNSDTRTNTNVYRTVIPESRRAVKEALEKGDMDTIKRCYKSAFDILYEYSTEVRDLKSKSAVYGDIKLNGLLRCLEAQKISPQSIGITDKQLEMCKLFEKRMDLTLRGKALQNSVMSHAANFTLTRGASEKDDFTKNPQILDDLIEFQAITYIQNRIKRENDVRYDGGGSYTSSHEDKIPPREPSPMEKLLMENPEGLIEYVKTMVYDSDGFRVLKNAKTFEEKAAILNNPEKLDVVVDVEFGIPEMNEKQPVDEILSDLGSQIEQDTEALKEFNAPDDKMMDSLNSGIEQVRNAYNDLIAMRASMADTSTPENLKKLGPAYAKLSEKMENFNFCSVNAGFDSVIEDGYGATFTFYANHIKNMDAYKAETEKLQAGAKMMSSGKLSVFSKNTQERSKAVVAASANKSVSEKAKGIVNKLVELNTNLNKAYSEGEKNPLENDKIKKMYEDTSFALAGFMDAKTAKGDEDLKYVLGGVQKSLNKDLHPVTPKDLAKSIKELEAHSTRIGGNSKEFNEMLAAAKDMLKADPKNPRGMKDLVENLSSKSQKYIDAKKVAPKTQTGKERLDIAKELRDITNILTPKMTKAIIHQAKAEVLKEPNKGLEKIQERKQASLERIQTAWQKKSGSELATGVSELMYMTELEGKAPKMSKSDLSQMLNPSVVEKNIQRLNKISYEVLKNTSAKDFQKAFDEKNVENFMLQRYKQEGAAAAERIKQQAAEPKAEKQAAQKASGGPVMG